MKVILVTVLSIVFLCSGCSSNIKEEQKSIKICSSLNETMTDILAEDFAKQQNVKVEVRHLPAGNLDERLNFLREGKFDVCHRPIPFVRNMVIWQESRKCCAATGRGRPIKYLLKCVRISGAGQVFMSII